MIAGQPTMMADNMANYEYQDEGDDEV